MSQIVKCEVCGGTYNQKYVSSHRRLAHAKAKATASTTHSDPEALAAIFSMYEQLSDNGKKEVRERITRVNPG